MHGRFSRAIASAVACALVGGLALLVSEPSASALQADTWASGVYPGPCRNASDADRADYVDQLNAFAKWRHQPVQFTMQFAPYTGTTNWLTTDEPNALFKCAVYVRNALHIPMMFAVPMLPLYDTEDQNADLSTTPAPTLRAGSTGAYDQYWRTLAQNLVSRGLNDTVMRIGWEFNGNWFRWSAKDDPAAWKAYWVHIVKAMRSVPGQAFKFDYSVALGSVYANPGDGTGSTYPGDAYVDTVSVSMYDQQYGHPACTATLTANCVTEDDRWHNLVTEKYGLNWLATFTRDHNKKIGFSEWALASTASFAGGGGGDDAGFMTDLHAWIAAHNVAYETYFNKDHQGNIQTIAAYDPSTKTDTDSDNFPLAEAEYRRLWEVGSGHSPSSSVLPSNFSTSATPTSSSPASSSPAPSSSSPSPSTSPTPTPKPLAHNTPLYSTRSNRANAKKLSRQKVKSNIYVFVNPSRSVLYAAWYLDDPKHKKHARRIARAKPFDLVGKTGTRALAFHVYGLSKGKHTLTVLLRWKSGGYSTYTVTFTAT
jgi:hypothetical protein